MSSGAILWNSTSVSLGMTAPAEIHDTSFLFKNFSSNPISISNAGTHCGCIALRVPNSAVLPDSTGVVIVLVKASQSEGPYRRFVHIAFDNGEVSELVVEGQTHSVFRISPPSILVRDAIVNATRTLSFDVNIDKETDAQILNARFETDDLNLLDYQQTEVRDGVRCFVTLVPRAAKPKIVSQLILETSHKRQPILYIPVMVLSALPLEINPSVAFLGVVKPGAKVSKRFSIISAESEPARIKTIKNAGRETKFTLEKGEGSYSLNVELLCAGKPGFVTGELVIELDDPSAPEVPIPYSYVVRE
ncbi:MAG: DUF1573 domain-containing protein [bacterium]